MATNEILVFSDTDTGTNLLTQAEYSADAQRPIGNQPGIARSKLVNKVLKQTSLMAAVLGKFVADNQVQDVQDTKTVTVLAGYLTSAVNALINAAIAALNLGNYALLAATQSWTKAQRGEQVQLADGATITPDFSAANNFQVQLAGNRTLANPSNCAAGQSGVLEIFQDANGSRTLSLDWGYSPPGGNAPTLSTTALTRDQWAYYVGTAADSVVTISIASPGVVSWANHGLKGGEKIRFSTTGALPTGISAGVTYFVKPVGANTFQLSATLGGTAINTSGTQSGVHTASARSITISQLKAIA